MSTDIDTTDFDEGLVLDLSGIEESQPQQREPLPPGRYPAAVESIDFGASKKSGSPMLTWVFRTTDENDRLVWYYTTLNDEIGKRRARDAVQRIKPDYDFTQFKPAELSELLVGEPCTIQVKIDPPYQGKRKNSVTNVFEPSDSDGGDFL